GVGDALGAAYQVADDLRDFAGTEKELGKPCGQDAAHQRPNAVQQNGLDHTLKNLCDLVGDAVAAIPDCPGAPMLRKLIEGEATRLVPKELAQSAA
ncbi:MAG: polyprenyl synthetase family protein, partial [Pseudomonadota bacterium]